MKLYGDSRSGNCDKILFVMHYLNLDHDWVELDSLQGETRTLEFSAINPMGQIPYLELPDGRGLAQSNAIIRFLANGTDLIPSDKYRLAEVDQWMFWEANNYEFFVASCIAHMTYLEQPKATRDPMRVERSLQSLQILDGHLTDRNWIVNEAPSVADAAVFGYTRKAHLGGFDMEKYPHIIKWLENCERVFVP